MASIVYNNLPFEENMIAGEAHNFALGRFITAWSQVEASYCAVARRLTNAEPTLIAALLDKARTREVLEILSIISHDIDDHNIKSELISLVERCQKISVKRNKIIPAGWGQYNGIMARFSHDLTMHDFEEIMLETQKGRGKRETRIFTVPDIETATEQCTNIRDGLLCLAPHLPDRAESQRERERELRAELRELRIENDRYVMRELLRVQSSEGKQD